MSCSHYAEQISCLLDDELVAEQQAELFGHLAACSNCRSFFETILRTRNALARDTIPYPAELDSVILAAQFRPAPARLAAWWQRPLTHSRLAVAAVALLVIAGTAYVTKITRPAPTTRYEVLFALPTVEVYPEESGSKQADSTHVEQVLQ
jgi:predicted anti-sigma-YlaC factor YlaD